MGSNREDAGDLTWLRAICTSPRACTRQTLGRRGASVVTLEFTPACAANALPVALGLHVPESRHTAALLRSLAGNFHNNQPISSQKPPREPSLDTYLQTNIDRQVCARHCARAGDTEMPPSTNLPDFSTMSNIPEQTTRGILRSSFRHLCGN